MNAAQDLARTVRRLRKARRLTQADLAVLAGVGRRFVSDLERGKPTLRLSEAQAVLSVFGLALRVQPLEKEPGS